VNVPLNGFTKASGCFFKGNCAQDNL